MLGNLRNFVKSITMPPDRGDFENLCFAHEISRLQKQLPSYGHVLHCLAFSVGTKQSTQVSGIVRIEKRMCSVRAHVRDPVRSAMYCAPVQALSMAKMAQVAHTKTHPRKDVQALILPSPEHLRVSGESRHGGPLFHALL